MAMIYYSKRLGSKISKGKKCMGKVQGNQVQASHGPLPAESHRTQFLQQSAVTTHTHCCVQGKLITDSVFRALIGSWSPHPLPNTYENPRLAEGRQMLGIIHIVCTNSLGTVNHSYHLGINENPPEIQAFRCQPRASLANRPAFSSLFTQSIFLLRILYSKIIISRTPCKRVRPI